MTHICVGNLTIIGSDNGLSPSRRQAIIWTNAFECMVCEMAIILSRPQCVKLIDSLFTISPDLKPFFGIPIQKEVDMDDPILGAHAGAFMGTLGIAVESLKDSQRVAELVTDLGHRHVDRKVHVNDLRVRNQKRLPRRCVSKYLAIKGVVTHTKDVSFSWLIHC